MTITTGSDALSERARIARDLHDDVSQQLAGISIAFSGIKQRLGEFHVSAALEQELVELQQQTLRLARSVRHLSHDLHPAVLRLVQFATEAALRLRMPVSVCGEMAGNARLVPLLLGLGIRSLSMNASAIPRVKQAVRSLDIADCARFARRVMEQSDPVRIHELVMGFAAGAAERA